MLGEAAVHADGVWKLQNDSTKEMTAQVSYNVPCSVYRVDGVCDTGACPFPLLCSAFFFSSG